MTTPPTFSQRALIIVCIFATVLWVLWVVNTSDRAERRVHRAEEVLSK